MKDTFIPKKIKVGYQERSGTYTGKLAYVIYYDHLKKLRKETSWNSWRNEKIDPSEFDNIPTEGFVLNKQVGGHGGGWDSRQSYCRIYDPRGFELEITTDNLLWILEWCDCLKGKGLSGKFVYGWIGDQLVLIPECTDDYKKAKEFSDKLFTKPTIGKSELEVGSLYKLKGESKRMIYIGNLRVQNKLGTGYSSKLMFCKEGNLDVLYPKSKTSVLTKEASGVLEEKEISEIVYRFSLTCFSWDFWNSGTEFIDHFEYGDSGQFKYERDTIRENMGTVKYNPLQDSCRSKLTCGIISDDSKSIKIFKKFDRYVEHDDGRGYFWSRRIDTSYHHLPFIELNTSGKVISKYYDIEIDYYSSSWEEKHKIYDESGNKISAGIDFRPYDTECLEKGNTIIYITKDGYRSDSLVSCIYTGDYLSFRYNTDTKISSDIYSGEQYFKLPIKIDKYEKN